MSVKPTNTYTHGHTPATIAGHSHRTAATSAAYLLPDLQPTHTLLDVGCGPGSITATLAPHVKRVVGIDSSSTAIAAAQAQFPGPEFLVGDMFDLPFEDGTFDVVHAHQVVVHLPLDKVGPALTEMRRVCKEGGLVAFRDGHSEMGGTQVWPYDPLLARTMDLFCQRMYLKSGVTPDSQGKWLAIARDEVGFKSVKRQFSLDVFDTPELRQMWGNQWASRTEEVAFKTFVTEKKLVSEEALREIPNAWRRWRDTKDGWCTLLELEHLCQK